MYKGRVIFGAVLFVLMLSLVSGAYGIDDMIMVDGPSKDTTESTGNAEFLSSQDLSFITCSDDIEDVSDVESYIFCYDNYKKILLEPMTWNESCVISVYNPYSLKCSSPSIVSMIGPEGEEKRLSEDLDIKSVIVEPDNILGMQQWDGGFGDPVDTAIAIWILSEFDDSYSAEIDSAMDWLKRNRNNDGKCWPSSLCNTEETAKVLSYLSLAGLNGSTRVFNDGKVWLENHQNYIVENDWSVKLSANEPTNCNLTVSGSTTEYDDINDSYSAEHEITAEYGMSFNASCTDTITFYLRDQNNLSIYTRTSNEDIIYSLPNGACWSANDWNGCNIRISMYGALANLSTERKDAAREYMEEVLDDNLNVGQYLPTADPLSDSAFYYRYVNHDSDIIRYLIYHQNNDGSFGDGSERDMLLRTMYAINAMEYMNYTFAGEAVRDARAWAEEKIYPAGFANILLDANSYIIMRDLDRKYVQTNPKFVDFTDDIYILKVINPTRYNFSRLTFTVEGKIKGIVFTNYTNGLDAYSSRSVILEKKSADAGIYSGYLEIEGQRVNTTNITATLARVPVYTEVKPNVELTPPKDLRIIGEKGEIEFLVKKANGDFSCSLKLYDDELSGSSFDVKLGQEKVKAGIDVKDAIRRSLAVDAGYICNFGEEIFSKNFTLDVEQYPKAIIDVAEDSLEIKRRTKTYKVHLSNLVDTPIDVSVGFSGSAQAYFMLESDSYSLSPKEEIEIEILNGIVKGENVTLEDKMYFEVLDDQRIEIPFTVEVLSIPFFQRLWVKIVKWAIFGSIILGLIYLAYYFSIDIKRELKKDSTRFKGIMGKVYMKIHGVIPEGVAHALHLPDVKKEEDDGDQEKPVSHSGVASLIKIMLSLDHDEKDIKKRLKKEGLTDKEIKEALAEVNEELSQEEELEKEENIIKVMKEMDQGSDNVRTTLRQAGFSDTQINQAFEEIEGELTEKEKELQENLAKFKGDEEEEADESVSLLDVEKGKNQ